MKRMGLSATVVKLDPSWKNETCKTEQDGHRGDFPLEDGSRAPTEFGAHERFLDISLTRKYHIFRSDLGQESPLCCSCDRYGDGTMTGH
jgi:CTP synthase (UTP-ammonia lyase)